MQPVNPVLIEATRGGMVESRHRGAAVVVDAQGRTVAAWGDVEALIYPRSAIKPIQALPLVESGAADRYKVGAEEIALACASHGGEPAHVDRVTAWLSRNEFSERDLECGAHMPSEADSSADLIRARRPATSVHNNCSGKHAGMLLTARHLGEPTRGYIDIGHPVQRRLRMLLADLGGCELERVPSGIDGCGIPVYAMPLKSLALAMARLADPETLPGARADAAKRVVQAMTAHPYLVAGRGRFDTDIMTAAKGAVAVKGGAEGVHAAILPALKLGVALKIDDGGAGRASSVAMAALLARLKALPEDRLSDWLERPVLNVAGRRVGAIRPAQDW